MTVCLCLWSNNQQITILCLFQEKKRELYSTNKQKTNVPKTKVHFLINHLSFEKKEIPCRLMNLNKSKRWCLIQSGGKSTTKWQWCYKLLVEQLIESHGTYIIWFGYKYCLYSYLSLFLDIRKGSSSSSTTIV